MLLLVTIMSLIFILILAVFKMGQWAKYIYILGAKNNLKRGQKSSYLVPNKAKLTALQQCTWSCYLTQPVEDGRAG